MNLSHATFNLYRTSGVCGIAKNPSVSVGGYLIGIDSYLDQWKQEQQSSELIDHVEIVSPISDIQQHSDDHVNASQPTNDVPVKYSTPPSESPINDNQSHISNMIQESSPDSKFLNSSIRFGIIYALGIVFILSMVVLRRSISCFKTRPTYQYKNEAEDGVLEESNLLKTGAIKKVILYGGTEDPDS